MTQNGVRQVELRIPDLISLVETGALALPDFQRPFEWTSQRTRSLIATIIMGWPAGSLLLMEAPPSDFFAIRAIEGASEADRERVRHLILDGQQRITSIFQAFSAKAKDEGGVWCLDLEVWPSSSDVDALESALVQRRMDAASDRYLPIHALVSSDAFFSWRNATLSIEDADQASQRYQALNHLWAETLAQVSNYAFAAQVLDRSMPLSSVAKIFERLNTKGMTLGTFDLVAAHVYRDGNNLRAVWDAAVQSRPSLGAFVARDPQISVEMVALRSRGDTRRESLLELDADEMWAAWPDVIRGLQGAADFLTAEAAIRNQAQLPHRAIFVVLATLASEYNLREHAATLRHWVFVSALTSRFDAAVNTRIVRDYRLLRDALRGKSLMSDLTIQSSTLARVTRRGSNSAWLGMQALLRRCGAHEFDTGLSFELFSAVPDMAVSVVNMPNPRTRAWDPVMGMVLVTKDTAELLERRGAGVLARLLASGEDTESVARFCDSQLIPPPGDSAYRSEQAFLERRAEIVEQRVRDLATLTPLDLSAGALGASRAELLTGVASSRLSAGDLDGAVGALRAVIHERDPDGTSPSDHAQDVVNLASALSIGGRGEEAVSVLRDALAADLAADARLVLLDALLRELSRLGRVRTSLEYALEFDVLARGTLGPESAVAVRAAVTLITVELALGREAAATDLWSGLRRRVESGSSIWSAGDVALQVFDGLVDLGEVERAREFRSWASVAHLIA